MTRILATGVRVAAITAVIVALGALGASDAAADEPHERPCQGWPRVEAAVRAALPTSTVVHCPKRKAEFEITGGRSVPLPLDAIEVEAVLRDGRIATLAVVPDNAELKQDARIQSISYGHSDLTGSSGAGMAVL